MVDVITSARPYARAAFATASQQKCVDQWQSLLNQLACCVQNEQMVSLMHHPQVSQEQLLAICQACTSAAKDDKHWLSFVRILIQKKRLPWVPAVAKLFALANVQAAGVLPVVIESGKPLKDDYLKRLLVRLENRLGQPLRHQTKLNAQLIDGIVIRMGNNVIDASLRGRLQAIRQVLIGAAIAND